MHGAHWSIGAKETLVPTRLIRRPTISHAAAQSISPVCLYKGLSGSAAVSCRIDDWAASCCRSCIISIVTVVVTKTTAPIDFQTDKSPTQYQVTLVHVSCTTIFVGWWAAAAIIWILHNWLRLARPFPHRRVSDVVVAYISHPYFYGLLFWFTGAFLIWSFSYSLRGRVSLMIFFSMTIWHERTARDKYCPTSAPICLLML